MTAGSVMDARDALGRRVSLLNDDPRERAHLKAPSSSVPDHAQISVLRVPPPPALVYNHHPDAQLRGMSVSPLYPTHHDYSYSSQETHHSQLPYENHRTDLPPYASSSRRPSSLSLAGSSSFEDDAVHGGSSGKQGSERSGKRFPCRYREAHGCDKTFTTSGHASRHSKIHTAEKAVPCTHPGCTKKFTRADNMKQHLETHSKGKSRSSTRPSGSSGSKSSSSSSSSSRKLPPINTARTPPLPSLVDPWNMRDMNLPILHRGSSVSPTDSAGLDALAMAVACQQRS